MSHGTIFRPPAIQISALRLAISKILKRLARWRGPFDVIILSDTVGLLEDVETTLTRLHDLSSNGTRIVVAYYSWLWTPVIALAELFGAKMRQIPLNRLGPEDVSALLELAEFDVIKWDWRQLLPRRLFGLGPLINRSLATLPIIRRLCVRHLCRGPFALSRRARQSVHDPSSFPAEMNAKILRTPSRGCPNFVMIWKSSS